MHEETESGRRGRSEGAQTFRRGRALHFLERLELRRRTLAAQLEEQAFESIRPVIAGELKAVDAVMQEFIQVFELHEKPECAESGHGRRGRHAGEPRREEKQRLEQTPSPRDSQAASAEQEESNGWDV